MKDIVNKIASLLNNNHGVDSKDITVIEERLNAAFPQDYITLLKRSNGGEGYGFCLDKNYSIFKCPLGDLDINEVVIVAKSTKDFFKKAMMEKL